MISVRDGEDYRDRRLLAWSFLFSLLANVLVWSLSLHHWSFLRAQPVRPQDRELIVSSTSLRIEHRDKPQPQNNPHRVTAPPPRPQRQTVQPRQQPVRPRQPEARPREIAREIPNATPVPVAAPRKQSQSTLAQQLAQQQQAFSREVAQLHAQNNPLSVATITPQAPSSYHKSYVDVSGKDRNGVQAILIPIKHWFDGALSCYYVHYDAQFSNGGSETGDIPWPVCYPRDDDKMLPLDRMHSLPVPAPQPGYALPAGTYITPFLRNVYNSRDNPSQPQGPD